MYLVHHVFFINRGVFVVLTVVSGATIRANGGLFHFGFFKFIEDHFHHDFLFGNLLLEDALDVFNSFGDIDHFIFHHFLDEIFLAILLLFEFLQVHSLLLEL